MFYNFLFPQYFRGKAVSIILLLIPMIVSMAVAFFDIHDALMPEGELALIYLIVFFGMFLTGPGRYNLDYMIDIKFRR